ncbi:MAG TPA: hypothetical protein VGX76_15295, partial [Pirellulales bacterium]|nr:hypothetical protein [Pirellulales bacterium]
PCGIGPWHNPQVILDTAYMSAGPATGTVEILPLARAGCNLRPLARTGAAGGGDYFWCRTAITSSA